MPDVDVILIEVPDEVGGYGAKALARSGASPRPAQWPARCTHAMASGASACRWTMPAAAALLPKRRRQHVVHSSPRAHSARSRIAVGSILRTMWQIKGRDAEGKPRDLAFTEFQSGSREEIHKSFVDITGGKSSEIFDREMAHQDPLPGVDGIESGNRAADLTGPDGLLYDAQLAKTESQDVPGLLLNRQGKPPGWPRVSCSSITTCG